MIYLKLPTMEYPRYEGDIRLEHSEIREDQTGDTFPVPPDYAVVTITKPPELAKDQYLTEDAPVQKDGKWYNVWIVKDMTPEQIDMRNKVQNEFPPKRMRPNVR